MTVIPFKRPAEDPEPQEEDLHATGEARCMACRFEWVAESPVGTMEMECPQCGCMKGLYKNFFMRGYGREDLPHWECLCGSDLFKITPRGVYCPACGRDHRPFDTPTRRA